MSNQLPRHEQHAQHQWIDRIGHYALVAIVGTAIVGAIAAWDGFFWVGGGSWTPAALGPPGLVDSIIPGTAIFVGVGFTAVFVDSVARLTGWSSSRARVAWYVAALAALVGTGASLSTATGNLYVSFFLLWLALAAVTIVPAAALGRHAVAKLRAQSLRRRSLAVGAFALVGYALPTAIGALVG